MAISRSLRNGCAVLTLVTSFCALALSLAASLPRLPSHARRPQRWRNLAPIRLVAGVQASLLDNKIHVDLPARSHPLRSTLCKDPTVQFLGRAASNMRNFVDRARLQATMVGWFRTTPLNPRRISSGCDSSNFLYAEKDLAHRCLPNPCPHLVARQQYLQATSQPATRFDP